MCTWYPCSSLWVGRTNWRIQFDDMGIPFCTCIVSWCVTAVPLHLIHNMMSFFSLEDGGWSFCNSGDLICFSWSRYGPWCAFCHFQIVIFMFPCLQLAGRLAIWFFFAICEVMMNFISVVCRLQQIRRVQNHGPTKMNSINCLENLFDSVVKAGDSKLLTWG